MSVFDTLGIKHINSNPYYPQGNGRIETSITSLHVQSWSSLMVSNSNGMMHSLWLPTAITLHHWQMTLSLHSILLHAKPLVENRITEIAIDKKVTKTSDLKIGQLVLIKNHQKGPFNQTYIYNHWIAGIPNESTVLLTAPDDREKNWNIHHVKLVSSLDVTTHGQSSKVEPPTGAFQQFWDSIQQDTSNDVGVCGYSPNHSYNLWSKTKRPLVYFHIV